MWKKRYIFCSSNFKTAIECNIPIIPEFIKSRLYFRFSVEGKFFYRLLMWLKIHLITQWKMKYSVILQIWKYLYILSLLRKSFYKIREQKISIKLKQDRTFMCESISLFYSWSTILFNVRSWIMYNNRLYLLKNK